MIKVEVIEKFTLKDFDELKSVERRSVDERGKLFVGDTFECSEDMVKYLMGDNPLKRAFVRVVEVAPKVEAPVEKVEEKPKKKTSKKKTK